MSPAYPQCHLLVWLFETRKLTFPLKEFLPSLPCAPTVPSSRQYLHLLFCQSKCVNCSQYGCPIPSHFRHCSPSFLLQPNRAQPRLQSPC